MNVFQQKILKVLETERHKDRKTERQKDRKTEKQRDKKTLLQIEIAIKGNCIFSMKM